MPHGPKTEIERIQRIETMVEQGFANIERMLEDLNGNRMEVRKELAAIREKMASDKKELEDAATADVADLARLKNRGAGIIGGLALAAGVAGVSFADAVKAAWKAFLGG